MRRSLLGVVAGIGITATMDATGLGVFSALPLFPLMALGWRWERFSRREMEFVAGRSPLHRGKTALT